MAVYESKRERSPAAAARDRRSIASPSRTTRHANRAGIARPLQSVQSRSRPSLLSALVSPRGDVRSRRRRPRRDQVKRSRVAREPNRNNFRRRGGEASRETSAGRAGRRVIAAPEEFCTEREYLNREGIWSEAAGRGAARGAKDISERRRSSALSFSLSLSRRERRFERTQKHACGWKNAPG